MRNRDMEIYIGLKGENKRAERKFKLQTVYLSRGSIFGLSSREGDEVAAAKVRKRWIRSRREEKKKGKKETRSMVNAFSRPPSSRAHLVPPSSLSLPLHPSSLSRFVPRTESRGGGRRWWWSRPDGGGYGGGVVGSFVPILLPIFPFSPYRRARRAPVAAHCAPSSS